MRLAPVALRRWQDRTQLIDVARRQSATTHQAPEVQSAAVAFAQLLADGIEGRPRSAVLRVRDDGGSGQVAESMTGRWKGRPRGMVRGSGYMVHSLEAALWAVGRTADFRGAVLMAANLGEDADTTGAITGRLAGALYGLSGMPAEWLGQFAWREKIEQAAAALWQGSQIQ